MSEVDDDAFFALFEKPEVAAIPDKEIAQAFGTSLPTVRRWRTRKNAPHPAMRKHVVRWIYDHGL